MDDLIKKLEIWRPIPGFNGFYEVSDMGRVRSLHGRHGKGRILRPGLPSNPSEYMCVSLHGGGRRTRRSVHRIVADVFLPPRPSSKHQIRHWNGNRGDNRAINLIWGTAQDNADDRARHGRTQRGSKHWASKLSEAEADQIRTSAEPTKILAERHGLHRCTIQKIRSGVLRPQG